MIAFLPQALLLNTGQLYRFTESAIIFVSQKIIKLRTHHYLLVFPIHTPTL
jgi:hypothetical protein